VLDTGDLDAYVIGHTGYASGVRLIVPSALADRVGGSAQDTKEYGVPIFVTKAGLPRPPDGWTQLGTPESIYQVVTAPDGRVTELQEYSTGALEDANWVIDLVVAPAILGLAKSGVQRGMSLIERLPVRQAPKVPVLAGPTREVAKDASAVAKVGVKQPVSKMAKVPRDLPQSAQEATDVLSDMVLGVKKIPGLDPSHQPGELAAHIARLRKKGRLTPDQTQAEIALREARKILRRGQPSDPVTRQKMQDLVDHLSALTEPHPPI
jgi:hypothetical protein